MGRGKLKNIAKLLESLNSETPVEQAFLHDLKRSIEMTDTKSRRKPSQTYKPSSMNCLRASYYQIKGVEQDPGDASYTIIGIRNSGTDIHVRIQQSVESMKDNGIDCTYVDVGDYVLRRNLTNLEVVGKSGEETKLYDKDLNMSFLCDGIINYRNHYYIIEFKTENSYKWTTRTGVDPSHYHQAIAYSLALHINDVMFVYINRDNLDMKCYLYNVTDEMRLSLIGYIANCDSYVDTNTVPPKEPETKKACTYCAYKERCESEK